MTQNSVVAPPWFGALPRHWRISQLRHVMRCLDGRRIPLNAVERAAMEGSIPYWGANAIMGHVDRPLFDEPLVLLGEDGAPFFDRSKSVAFFVNEPVWVNNHAHVLRPIGVEPRYLMHVLNTTDYAEFVEGSTRDKLTQGKMNAIPVPLPPPKEQGAIVHYLDRKTVAIDDLIRKKERLIELLQEKRQALITQAVTKGLDPSVPMKDSCLEWIGKIPRHWECRRLKQVASRVVVGIAQAATHAYADTGIPIIRSTNVRPDRVSLDDLLYIDETFANSLRSKYMHPGDLVTVRTGNAGVTAVVPSALPRYQCFTMLITTLRPPNVPQFFSAQLNSNVGRTYFGAESWGSAQANISVPILQNAPVVVPPPVEQRSVIAWFGERTGSLDETIAKTIRQLDLLREYRQALVTAAVTGQLDIPAEAA